MKRIVYRKWHDPSASTDHFLAIYPSGCMVEISIREDRYDIRAEICRTKPLNPLAAEPFIKHKQVATKADFEGAVCENKIRAR